MEIPLLLVFILLSGFFSGSEIALFSMSAARVHALKQAGVKNTKLLESLKARPQKLLIAILIGNNLVNIGASSLATLVAIKRFGSAGVGVATGVMTFLILFFGEIIPKSVAQQRPEKIALFIAPIMKFGMIVLWPAIWIMHVLTLGFQKLIKAEELDIAAAEDEVKAMMELGHKEGEFKRDEKEMVHNVFLLNDITASDVMTPDEYVVGFDINTPLREAMPIIASSGFSRFPIRASNSRDVEGTLYIKDVFSYLIEDGAEQQEKKYDTPVSKLMKEAVFVPETMLVDDLMKDLQKRRVHIGVVVDEHGLVQGIATLEDLVEEIVGEIIDETDMDDQLIRRIDKQTIGVDPRVEVSHVNHFFNTKLEAPANKTIGWLVLKEFGRIPKTGDTINVQHHHFVIEEADNRRIKRMKMIKTAPAKTSPAPSEK